MLVCAEFNHGLNGLNGFFKQPTIFFNNGLNGCLDAFQGVHLSQVHQPSKIDILPQISDLHGC